MNNIRKVRILGHELWQVEGEIVAGRYVLHLLKLMGKTKARAVEIMTAMLPVLLVNVYVPLVALVHRSRVIGYRCSTWVGERCATMAAMTRFLRREGFSTTEIDSLFMLARREIVSRPDDVRRMIQFGIRP